MHFHWDNFDTFARRALRVFAPPIVNFLLLLIVFSQAVSKLLNWIWEKVSDPLKNIVSMTDNGTIGQQTDTKASERDLDALAIMFETITRELLAAEVSWPSLNALVDRVLSALGSAAYATAITTALSLLLLAFLLDWALRGFALLLPFRLRTKERALVHHSRFNEGFLRVQKLLNVDTTARAENGQFSGGEKRRLCKHEIWTRIQAILDNTEGKSALYRHSREGLLLSIDENRKWFSYAIAYGALFIVFWVRLDLNFPEFFSGIYLYGGVIFVLIFAIILIFRHIQMSVELIDLDIEAFLAIGDFSNQKHEIGDAKDKDHEHWRTVIGILGWSNRDPSSMFFKAK